MLAAIPKTRSELLNALQRASFRTVSIGGLTSSADVRKATKALLKHVQARKTRCLVILLDK